MSDHPGLGQDEAFMRLALEQARLADQADEVPVGAVVVCGGQVIGTGHNRTIAASDPTAHAEMLAIREAALGRGDWRLEDCDLYVTLEPCAMCAAAAVWARIGRIVFGPTDPKAGACGSVLNVADHPMLNHRVELVGGVLADESRRLLQGFFKRQRQLGKK